MLVIRRRAGESVFIGDDVEIHVLEISATQVKLGIQAPRRVPVLRREIYLTAAENRTAASLASDSVPKLMEQFRRATPSKVSQTGKSLPLQQNPNPPK